jgi:predicted MFS family arabinose efflux permease
MTPWLENFFGAFRAGLRYTRASKPLHVVLLRAAIFFAFASAVWALLPLVARQMLGGDASFYGILLGAVGAGAIGGALVMPKLRERFDADGLLLGAAVITALVMGALSLAPPQMGRIIVLLFLGGAWITALTTLNGAAQAVLPNWVRGRGLAVYLTVFNGAMTAGSLGWGAIGEAAGDTGGTADRSGGTARCRPHHAPLEASGRRRADMVPSNHWPEPLSPNLSPTTVDLF